MAILTSPPAWLADAVLYRIYPRPFADSNGDEIGMRHLPGLPDKGGSRLNAEARQGSRTPMQWTRTGPDGNAGFSTAPADRLCLPIDPAPDRPAVQAAQQHPDSLPNQVKALIRLRAGHRELGTGGTVRMVHDGYPGVYVRGERYVVILNPSARPEQRDVSDLPIRTPLIARGVVVEDGVAQAEPFGYGVFELAGKFGEADG